VLVTDETISLDWPSRKAVTAVVQSFTKTQTPNIVTF